MISGKKFDIDPPASAPTKLAKTRADEEPKKPLEVYWMSHSLLK